MKINIKLVQFYMGIFLIVYAIASLLFLFIFQKYDTGIFPHEIVLSNSEKISKSYQMIYNNSKNLEYLNLTKKEAKILEVEIFNLISYNSFNFGYQTIIFFLNQIYINIFLILFGLLFIFLSKVLENKNLSFRKFR